MNIAYIDLETSPILGYAYGFYETTLLSIEKDSTLLSVAYKINDGKTVVFSRREYTEKQLVNILWRVLNDNDVIVAQNGDNFDIKVANTFFVRHKLKPPAPFKTVDTLKLARKYFKFPSNKLDYISQILLNKRKIETDKSLWFDCMKGDETALRKMERYNVMDVELCYEIYHKMKGWHTGHPNSNVYLGSTHKCPACAGNTQKRGFMVTRARKYQRYQCVDCGMWSKGELIKTAKPIS